jgi:hypothetical protein
MILALKHIILIDIYGNIFFFFDMSALGGGRFELVTSASLNVVIVD